MAKKGSIKLSEKLVFSVEAAQNAKEALGEEWAGQLQERFSSYSPTGSLELTKADMANFLKAVFQPSKAKIEMVMQFFAMTTGGDTESITVESFINGMTLLYGDLAELAATSPKPKDESSSPPGMVEQHDSPSGDYALREHGIFGSPLALDPAVPSRDPSLELDSDPEQENTGTPKMSDPPPEP